MPEVKLERELIPEILMESSQKGYTLLRNNAGGCYDERGRFLRYGLGNISDRVWSSFRTPDYVGWKQVIITPDMVGGRLPIFTGIEFKRSDWREPRGEREILQERFLDTINKAGGIGEFINARGQLP